MSSLFCERTGGPHLNKKPETSLVVGGSLFDSEGLSKMASSRHSSGENCILIKNHGYTTKY